VRWPLTRKRLFVIWYNIFILREEVIKMDKKVKETPKKDYADYGDYVKAKKEEPKKEDKK
jgi:hypothetical protein